MILGMGIVLNLYIGQQTKMSAEYMKRISQVQITQNMMNGNSYEMKQTNGGIIYMDGLLIGNQIETGIIGILGMIIIMGTKMSRNKIIMQNQNLMVSMQQQESNDMQITIILWEMTNITQYQVLSIKISANNMKEEESQAASQKYIILSAFTSSLFIQGIGQIYGMTGSTDINTISLQSPQPTWVIQMIIVPQVMKQGLAPIHSWIVEQVPKLRGVNIIWQSVMPKMTMLILLNKMVAIIGKPDIMIIVWASIIIGSLGQGSSNNILKIITYSGIGQQGQILIQLNTTGYNYYIIIYGLTNLNLLIGVQIASPTGNKIEISGIKKGLGMSQGASLLSLAGIPPLGGFYGKILIQMTAKGGLLILVIITSIITIYYYQNQIQLIQFGHNRVARITEVTRGKSLLISSLSTSLLLFPLWDINLQLFLL